MRLLILFGMLFFFASDANASGADTIKRTRKKNIDTVQYGVASYYNSSFQGRPTASGEAYDQEGMTAAHNSLPFGTWVRVSDLRSKRSVVVRINDRLHFRNTRLVDLSKRAAGQLGILSRGLARVKLEILPARPEDGE